MQAKPSDAAFIATRQLSAKRRMQVTVAALVIGFGLLAAAYYAGLRSSQFLSGRQLEQISALRTSQAEATAEIEELKATLALAERQLQINASAYRELNDALTQSDDNIQRLERELSLYRSIISPADGAEGLKIYDFDIRETADGLRLDLTLIQSIEQGEEIRGGFYIEVFRGDEREAAARWPDSGRQAFAFRYFQRLNATIPAPGDTSRLRFEVVVAAPGKAGGRFTYWYPE